MHPWLKRMNFNINCQGICSCLIYHTFLFCCLHNMSPCAYMCMRRWCVCLVLSLTQHVTMCLHVYETVVCVLQVCRARVEACTWAWTVTTTQVEGTPRYDNQTTVMLSWFYMLTTLLSGFHMLIPTHFACLSILFKWDFF